MLKAKSIELIDVTKRFDRGIVAVTNFNLAVPGGEFVTLLGPSGCGKTTLLRMVAGLERPTSGRILIDNEDVTDVPPNLRDTSIMFQDYALFPHKTVFENIGFGLKLRGLNRRTRMPHIQAMLELVHLPDVGDRKPSQLSGGQKQRVALARSLVIEPAILLLDEPLGALDANLRGRMQVELKRVQRKVGITFFYVTHDQEEALTMSDRIVLMREGRIEQIGSPSEIYHRPRTEFVATFIGQCNILPAIVAEVSRDSVACQHDVFGRVVACNPFSVAVTPGHGVKLAIRPERLVLGGNGHGMENGGPVRLRDQIFMGSTRRSIVESGVGQELTVEGQSAGESWSDGESLHIAWLARDTLILATE